MVEQWVQAKHLEQRTVGTKDNLIEGVDVLSFRLSPQGPSEAVKAKGRYFRVF